MGRLSGRFPLGHLQQDDYRVDLDVKVGVDAYKICLKD